MLRNALALLLVAVAWCTLAIAPPAHAQSGGRLRMWTHPSLCFQINDGCAGATVTGSFGSFNIAPPPIPSFKVSNEFANCSGGAATSFYQYVTTTACVGSGQSWAAGAHPWSYDAPGVDYGIGYDTTTPLKNPATTALPAGCLYYTSKNYGNSPEVYCNGSGSLTLSGWAFGRNAAAGTTQCVILEISSNYTGTVNINNADFEMGPECAQDQVVGSIDTNGVLTVTQVYYGVIPPGKEVNIQGNSATQLGTVAAWAGGQPTCDGVPCTGTGGVGTYLLSTSAFGSISSQNMFIGNANPQIIFDGSATATKASYDVLMYDFVLDGHARLTDTVCGGVPCAEGGVTDNRNGGARIWAYFSALYPAGRFSSAGNLGTNTALVNNAQYLYFYVEGLAMNGYGSHGETMEDQGIAAGTLPLLQYSYFVAVTPHFYAEVTAPLYIGAGTGTCPYTTGLNSCRTWTNTQIDHGIEVGNSVQVYNPLPGLNSAIGTAIASQLIEINRSELGTVNINSMFLDPTGTFGAISLTTNPVVTSHTTSNVLNIVGGNICSDVWSGSVAMSC